MASLSVQDTVLSRGSVGVCASSVLVGCQVILQASTVWPSASVSSHKLRLTWARVPPSAQPETHLATPTVDGASSL